MNFSYQPIPGYTSNGVEQVMLSLIFFWFGGNVLLLKKDLLILLYCLSCSGYAGNAKNVLEENPVILAFLPE